MSEQHLNEFEPDYAVPPGEILAETLESQGIVPKDFAALCGLQEEALAEIIAGRASVTHEMALCFEGVLGVSAVVWDNLESLFREHVARSSQDWKPASVG